MGFGGRDVQEIVRASMSVELAHNWLLVHDDIIDKDELRRGKPTMHVRYAQGRKNKHYGASMAIVAGDIMAMLSGEALLESDFPAMRRLRALHILNRTVINTCFGEMLDVDAAHQPGTEQEVLDLHALKTAIYTIDGPLKIGAALAGASEAQSGAIADYAIPIGTAFQLQDDMLGLYGDERQIGKPVGSDVKEGKMTLLIVKALELAAPEERRYIKKCMGNSRLTNKQLGKVRAIVESSGSRAYSERLMEDYYKKGVEALSQLKVKSECKEFLCGLADFIVARAR
jgi:geranylgeranyl diphosphate synthase type I